MMCDSKNVACEKLKDTLLETEEQSSKVYEQWNELCLVLKIQVQYKPFSILKNSDTTNF